MITEDVDIALYTHIVRNLFDEFIRLEVSFVKTKIRPMGLEEHLIYNAEESLF